MIKNNIKTSNKLNPNNKNDMQQLKHYITKAKECFCINSIDSIDNIEVIGFKTETNNYYELIIKENCETVLKTTQTINYIIDFVKKFCFKFEVMNC